jgi:general L-amino acid transport system permease protein
MTNAVAWARRNLFARPVDVVLTAVVAAAILGIAYAILDWAVLSATWSGNSRADCSPEGACWAFVVARAGQFTYGFYPPDERWRVDVAFLLLAVGIAVLVVPRLPGKRLAGILLLTAFPVLAVLLLKGGAFGLSNVPTDRWGGLFLTLVLGVAGIVLSFPMAIFLALGRHSDLLAIRIACTFYIEICRGLPLIAVLFMARILLPYALPVGSELDPLGLAVTGIVMFEAAYLAEVFRGGLQSLPRGQYEAAAAIGFGYWRTTLYVILPQVMRNVVPGLVNNSIALLKNTTLVVALGLFEILNIVAAGASDPQWLGLAAEGYFVAGLVFWSLCFAMSRYSRGVERSLLRGR